MRVNSINQLTPVEPLKTKLSRKGGRKMNDYGKKGAIKTNDKRA